MFENRGASAGVTSPSECSLFPGEMRRLAPSGRGGADGCGGDQHRARSPKALVFIPVNNVLSYFCKRQTFTFYIVVIQTSVIYISGFGSLSIRGQCSFGPSFLFQRRV